MLDQYLPPRKLWPDLVYRLPQLQYADALNVAEVLLAGAGRRAGRAAIVHRGVTTTYGALASRVHAIASALTRLGVQPADRVAFRLQNSPEFIAVWLAIQWIGAVGVPIPPPYRRREIAHIVNDSGAVLLLCAADLADDVDAARPLFRVPVRVEVTETGAPAVYPNGHAAPTPFPAPRFRPALITYITSADSAARAVVQTPATLLAPSDTYAREVLRLTDADVCAGSMSMAWAFGLGALLIFPLRVGATTVLLDPQTQPLANAIAAARTTVLYAVPTLYRILLQQLEVSAVELRDLRAAVSAAEPLSPELWRQWRARTGLELLDGLGTTELSHICISARQGRAKPGSLGMAVPGYDARVVDDDMRECPAGVEGRLAVRGPTGCLYWGDVEAQKRAVRDGWTLTGDIGVRCADGMFRHVRRADALIVNGGYKVSVAEVQRVLKEHPAVADARVFACRDPVRGAVVAAEVTAANGAAPGLTETLQQFLKRELAPYKCPKRISIKAQVSSLKSQGAAS